MGGQTFTGAGVWAIGASPLRVEYSAPVLDQVRAAAIDGLCTVRRGGVEVGGILFGTAGDGTVRVLAHRPVTCCYAAGPSFTITGADEAVFESALKAPCDGLQPVGWYHSHTRAGLELRPADVALHERYFPAPFQVALVVRPEPFGTAAATFYLRGPDGALSASPDAEFVLRPNGVPRRRPVAHASACSRGLPPTEVPEQSLQPVPRLQGLSSDSPESVDRAASRGRRWIPAVAAVVVAVAAWAAVLLWHPREHARIALHVSDTRGLLRIVWDRNAEPIRQATGAALEILDGAERVQVPFDREKLRSGSVIYSRRTGNVEVRLRVFGPSPAEEFVRMLGPAQSEPDRTPAEPPAAPAPSPLEPEPESQVARAEPPARAPRPPARQVRTDEPAAVAPVRRLDLAALPAPPRRGVPAPPLMTAAIALPRLAGPISAPPSSPPPPPARAETARRTIYSGPQNGRLIWVGQLAAGATLAIDGQRASSGVLNGELPGVPVRIAAHLAELSSGGLKIWASNPALTRRGREPAGPHNGWHPTTYAWDSARASDVLVVEAPSPQNRWKGMAVRGSGSPVSMIVIDWRVADN